MNAQIDTILSLLNAKKEPFEIISRLVTKEILLQSPSLYREKFSTILIIQGHYEFIQYMFDRFDYFQSDFFYSFKRYLSKSNRKPYYLNQFISKTIANYSENNNKINLLVSGLNNIQLNNFYQIAKFIMQSDFCDLNQLYENSNVLHLICGRHCNEPRQIIRQKKLIDMALLKNVSVCQLNNRHQTPISIALRFSPYLIDHIIENYKNISLDDLQNNLNDYDKIVLKKKFIKKEKSTIVKKDDIQLFDYVSYQYGDRLLNATVISETKFNYVTIIIDLIKDITTDWTADQLRITVDKSKLKKIKLADNEIIPGSLITSIDKVQLGMLIKKGLMNYKEKYIISNIDKEKNEITIKESNDTSKMLHKEQIVEIGLSRFRYALPE